METYFILKDSIQIQSLVYTDVKTNQTNFRIPELDGLRGIAILLVIGFHYINNQLVHSQDTIGRILSTITSFGWIGVDLFFVLSGFLIGNILISNRKSKNFFKAFFVRRFLRIIPNYYLLILVFTIICKIPYFQSNTFLTGNNSLPLWSYFAMVHNIFMATSESLGNNAMSITWSIGIEEQFYIVMPLVTFLLQPRWLPYILLLAIAAAPLLRSQYDHWIPAYVLPFCRMDALAIGVLVAHLYRKNHIQAIGKMGIRMIVLSMILVISFCVFLFLKYHDLGVTRNTLFAVFFAGCLVLSLINKDTIYKKLLRNKILMWIGTLSYSLYLFHYMILAIAHHITSQVSIGIYNGRGILVSIAAFFISLFVAWIIYKKLETPMVMAGKKFRYNS